MGAERDFSLAALRLKRDATSLVNSGVCAGLICPQWAQTNATKHESLFCSAQMQNTSLDMPTATKD
jgi:hypothetical protein